MTNQITVSRELLRQVLDAFETYAKQYPGMWKGYLIDAEQALRTALEQPAVEPVAWRVHPATYGVGHDGVYALTTRTEQVDAWRRKGWEVEPLYTAPQAQQEKP